MADQVYTQPVGTVDLTPTVMGFLDLPADPDNHGRDLSSALADSSKRSEERSVTFLRNAGTSAAWVAAVDSRFKLILSVNDRPWLFDALEDPDELQNFHDRPDTAAVSKRLGQALQDYAATHKDPYLSHPRIAASLTRILGDAAGSKKP